MPRLITFYLSCGHIHETGKAALDANDYITKTTICPQCSITSQWDPPVKQKILKTEPDIFDVDLRF